MHCYLRDVCQLSVDATALMWSSLAVHQMRHNLIQVTSVSTDRRRPSCQVVFFERFNYNESLARVLMCESSCGSCISVRSLRLARRRILLLTGNLRRSYVRL